MTKNANNIVYLDNNATTELSQDAAGVVMDIVLHNIYGNPSSSHTVGSKVRTIVDAARYSVAQSLGCSSDEIIFTSGGTESNNLAIKGICGSPELFGLVISSGEHSSVRESAIKAVGNGSVRYISLTPSGSVDLNVAEEVITEDIALVSVMLANNETGVIFPINEIVEIAHSRGVLVHCDAVQAYGKIPVNVKDLGVDLLSVSGHKVHALPGTGALYVRRGVMLGSQMSGGGHEGGLRSGTENYVGIATLGTVANEIINRKGIISSGLRDAFEAGIKKRIPGVVINGATSDRIPNTSSIVFRGVHSAAMLTALESYGVFASAGSACSSGSTKLSPTLLSMGLEEEDVLSTIRFSFSYMSKIMDSAKAIDACVNCVSALRQGAEY